MIFETIITSTHNILVVPFHFLFFFFFFFFFFSVASYVYVFLRVLMSYVLKVRFYKPGIQFVCSSVLAVLFLK